MEKELTDEEVDAIQADALARLKAGMAWQAEHKEEADKIILDATGTLALRTSTLEHEFPTLALCPTGLVVGAFQSAYIAGYLRGAKLLNIDKDGH